MKNKLLLLPLIFLLTSCEFVLTISNSNSDEITSNSDDISPSFNESTNDNSLSETLLPSINDSFSDSSDNSSNQSPDISDKEYLKSLVNRQEINYSDKLINDASKKVRKLEVYQLNDTHGAYLDDANTTGIARVKNCIDSTLSDPYAAVKIANGDMLQGSAFSNMLMGEPAIAALNEMNFDCFVLGNHEFDWGVDGLYSYKDGNPNNGELDCPFLAANLVDGNGNRPDWIQPYTIVEKGDLKVGVIGVIGDGLENSISKTSLGDYKFTSTVEAVNKYCEEIKSKVDSIIVASHAHDELINQEYVNSNNIDLIINGHDHRSVEEVVYRYDDKVIPVIESYTKNYNIGKVELLFDENKEYFNYNIMHYNPEYYELDENLNNIMEVYNKVTKDIQNQVIGYNAGGMSRDELSITTCNYIQDKYEVDLAFFNTGGVRADLPYSDIKYSHLYEAFPFDNELYICEIKGSDLKKMIPYASMESYYYSNKNLGMSTSYDFSNVILSKTYKVLTVDYVATKDYMSKYFSETYNLIKTGDYIRDCAIENISRNYKK